MAASVHSLDPEIHVSVNLNISRKLDEDQKIWFHRQLAKPSLYSLFGGTEGCNTGMLGINRIDITNDEQCPLNGPRIDRVASIAVPFYLLNMP